MKSISDLIFRLWTSTILQTIFYQKATPVSFCSKCRVTLANEFFVKNSHMPFISASLLVSQTLLQNITYHLFIYCFYYELLLPIMILMKSIDSDRKAYHYEQETFN